MTQNGPWAPDSRKTAAQVDYRRDRGFDLLPGFCEMPISGFATSRAQSTNSWATGVRVRFFSVTTPIRAKFITGK
jgi:hypothetical protein